MGLKTYIPKMKELNLWEFETLKFVNKLRQNTQVEPLEELRTGARFKNTICPISRSLIEYGMSFCNGDEEEACVRIEAEEEGIFINIDGRQRKHITLPLSSRRFISYFDT